MRKCNRRDFVAAAALGAVFAPYVRLITPSQAQTELGPAKYLFIFFTAGTEPSVWSPRGSTSSSLSHSVMTEPLAPLNQNLVLVERLDSKGTAGSHGAPGGLCGANFSGTPLISVEQYISDELRNAGVKTQIPNLLLGGVSSEGQSTFYRDNRVLSPIFTPSAAHAAIFGGGFEFPTDSSEPPADARLRRRRSMLDALNAEIGQLSQALGAEERAKLEAHTESLRQVEERLAQQEEQQNNPDPVAACNPPADPGAGSEVLLNSVLHMDLAINAFACDLTRVAAIQFGHHQNTQVNLSEVGAPGDWHNGFIHSDNPRTRLVNLERWLAAQFVAAANKLKETAAPDGNGTLFDQTLMVWARDMGDGVSHTGTDMRFVLSGGAGGYLRTGGSYIDGGGKAHSKVLANMIEAMGISSASGLGDGSTDREPLGDLRA